MRVTHGVAAIRTAEQILFGAEVAWSLAVRADKQQALQIMCRSFAVISGSGMRLPFRIVMSQRLGQHLMNLLRRVVRERAGFPFFHEG
ncbi:hypothetical protein D3C81_1511950 [compost metagenome]